jgi:DNA-binding Lrp family transcriptional regulator
MEEHQEVLACVLIDTEPGLSSEVAGKVANSGLQWLHWAAVTKGAGDVMAACKVRDDAALQQFVDWLQTVPGVTDTQTLVMSEVHKPRSLPRGHSAFP